MKSANPPATQWYKQFWAWVVFGLPACAVIAGLVTVWIAHDGADTLVKDQYYKEGLAINRTLEQQQRAEDMGLQALLSFNPHPNNPDKLALALELTGNIIPDTLQLQFDHPVEPAQDFTLVLKGNGQGSYFSALPASTRNNHWYLSLQADMPTPWRIIGTWNPASGNTARLAPDNR
jgi:hypothetical protein